MAVLRAYTLQDLFANLAGAINSNTDTTTDFEVVDNFVNATETLIINGSATPPSVTTTTEYTILVAGDYPISYWRLAETTGGVANDSNLNLLATYPRVASTSMTSITQGASSFLANSNAAQFTATTSAIVFPNSAPLQAVGDLTIEFWFNLSSLGTSGTSYSLFSKEGVSSGTGEYAVYFFNNSGVGRISYVQSGMTLFSAGTISTGTWYHIAVTRVAATKTVTIYINGSSAGSSTYVSAPATTTNPVTLGNRALNAPSMSMTEAALYLQALSSTRVAAHHTWGAAADATAVAYGGAATKYNLFPYPLFSAPTATAYGAAATTWGSFVWGG